MSLPTAPTSIEIRLRTSAGNYKKWTITAQADGSVFDTVRLNELRCDINDATDVGSPNMASIADVQIIMTFSSSITDTDFRVDEVAMYIPTFLDLEYYSFNMAKTSSSDETRLELLTETAGTENVPLIQNAWRRPFARACLSRIGEPDNDSRVAKWAQEYGMDQYLQTGKLTGWLSQLNIKYPTRRKHQESFWY